MANLTVDAVEVILENAVLKGRTIRRKRMTAVPTHRSMAADAVFARVGGILVRNGQGGMPNRISRRLGHQIANPTVPWLMEALLQVVPVASLARVGTGQWIQHLDHVVRLGTGLQEVLHRGGKWHGIPEGEQYGWNQNQHILSPTVQYVRDHPLDAQIQPKA